MNPVRDHTGMYYTYVLKSEKNGRWYTGSTNNLRERLLAHNKALSSWTKKATPRN